MNSQQVNYSEIHSRYREMEVHLLGEDNPSIYLENISQMPWFQQHPFQMLYRQKNTEQSPEHHPEGNVWNHTLLVVDEASKVKTQSKNPVVFMWAALLHDIGKPSTTKMKKGRITAYDHDKAGEKLVVEFLKPFSDNTSFIHGVAMLVRYHMQILYVLKDLPFADVQGMKENTNIEEVALLGLCDRLGRGNANRKKEHENIRLFLQKCRQTLNRQH